MTTPALDALRALLPLLARDEDRAVTGVFGSDTLDAIDAARALIGDDDADDAGLRHESVEAKPWVIDGIRALEAAVRHEAACVEAAKAEIKALRSELVDLRSSMAFRTSLIGRTEAERDTLRAKIEQMERQEPVAWYSKQYGFVYMSRQPSQFEHGSILYLRNGAPAWRIEGSSKVALLDIASLPHGTVFYALPGAKGD